MWVYRAYTVCYNINREFNYSTSLPALLKYAFKHYQIDPSTCFEFYACKGSQEFLIWSTSFVTTSLMVFINDELEFLGGNIAEITEWFSDPYHSKIVNYNYELLEVTYQSNLLRIDLNYGKVLIKDLWKKEGF